MGCWRKTIVKRRLNAAAIFMLLSLILAGSARLDLASAQTTLDKFAYLPLVMRSDACQLSPAEARIVELMQTHPEQMRPGLTCDPILATVARERAQDMATRGYFGHVNPDGYGPNCLVIMAGYPLPAWYAPCPDGNNIESIAGGYSTPDAAWQGWMNSTGHRTHLLGLSSFFAEQIEYGIGYVYDPDSQYGHYWVAITAKRE
jgi:hypothetical protein